MSLLHVRQIETHLREVYQEHWKAGLGDEQNLSRLLARRAVDMALGNSTIEGTASVEITDGGRDRGMDAVAVDPSSKLVIITQSKWRRDGTGSVDLGSVLKFVDGVRSLLDITSGGIATCSPEMKHAVRRAMQTPGARLQLVIATTASNPLSEEVAQPLNDLLAIFNDVGDDKAIAFLDVFTQLTFFDALAQPNRKTVDLDVHLLDWGRTLEPVLSYYGRAGAAQIAQWFNEHGNSLFAENIRVVLPRSEINDGILRTISKEPHRFWYYNNGITILSTKIDRSLMGSANRDAGFFSLRNASVINGAQTVSTLGRALRDGHRAGLEQAYVTVRCIEISPDDAELGRQITRFANTQNVVSSQDFVFLDDEQHRLSKELRVLGFEYILRSGETPTLNDPSKVIDVRQAAVALACASSEMSHAVIAKREVSRLFDRESGPYAALFNPTVNGLFLQRAVEITRLVDEYLDALSSYTDGVLAGVAIHSRRIIAHLILNSIGKRNLGDPDFDYESAKESVPGLTAGWLQPLTDVFPANAYPGNAFKNQARCVDIVSAARKHALANATG